MPRDHNTHTGAQRTAAQLHAVLLSTSGATPWLLVQYIIALQYIIHRYTFQNTASMPRSSHNRTQRPQRSTDRKGTRGTRTAQHHHVMQRRGDGAEPMAAGQRAHSYICAVACVRKVVSSSSVGRPHQLVLQRVPGTFLGHPASKRRWL